MQDVKHSAAFQRVYGSAAIFEINLYAVLADC